MLNSEKIVVLNVDDYEAGRYATTRVLRQAGYEVVEAASGEEALRIARERPDLVVLDVDLPDLSGFEVCERIKSAPETADIPVLYLSAAYRGAEHRVQGLELGADGYLTQPVDPRELVATVNALMRARHVRNAVRENEERFRALLVATSDIIWRTSPTGEVVDELPDWSEFTGQTREEYLGWGWLDAVHPDDRAHTAEVFARALDDKSIYETEYRLRRRDGEYRYTYVRGVPVQEADGAVREWVGANSDVTGQRLAQRTLQRQAEQLKGLTEASLAINSARTLTSMMQVITDQARAVIGAHQAVASLTVDRDWAQAITAVSLSDRYGGWADYTVPPGGSVIYALVCESNQPVRMTQEELERHPRWPGFREEVAAHPPMRGWLAAPLVARDGSNVGVIQLSDKYDDEEFNEADEAILVQLAAMVAVAVENSRLLAESQAANRAKADFLATMSHELRTPLNAMVGYTDLLMLGVPEPIPESAQDQVERIRSAATHLTQLIEEVLTHARIEAGRDELHLETVELEALIGDVAALMEPLARQKGLQFSVVRDAPPAQVVTDSRKLRQILLNLLGNAVKFTDQGEVRLVVRDGGGHLRIEVSDTGAGIAPRYLEKIFEPFWQVDGTKTRRVGGTGLGLSVVRQLAQRLGGNVWVESEPGRGSTFHVRLPLQTTEGEPAS